MNNFHFIGFPLGFILPLIYWCALDYYQIQKWGVDIIHWKYHIPYFLLLALFIGYGIFRTKGNFIVQMLQFFGIFILYFILHNIITLIFWIELGGKF